MGLSRKWADNRREYEASKYDDVVSQIDSGSLSIKGKDKDEVKAKAKAKAKAIRSGKGKIRSDRTVSTEDW